MPKVSVITPTYNVEPYIAQCIESVQSQSLTDWEMILVDDASTDGTVAVIERYLSDPRIKLFRNDQNRGPGYSRNQAIDEAQGEWITMLDSDDWFAPNRLERLVEFAETMQADMVADLIKAVAPDGKVLWINWSTFGRSPNRARYYSVQEVIKSNPSFKPLIRHQFLKEHQIRFLTDIYNSEDYAFYIEILFRGAQLAVLPEPLYCYRVRPGSLVSTHRRHSAVEQMKKSYEYLYQLAQQIGLSREANLLTASYRRRVVQELYPEFVDALKQRDYSRCVQVFLRTPSVLLLLIKRIPGAIYRRLFARGQLVRYRDG